MEDYNKIIESLGIRFVNSKSLILRDSVCVNNFKDVSNVIILVHKGGLAFGKDQEELQSGDVLFVPGGRATNIRFGKDQCTQNISNDKFINSLDSYFSQNTNKDQVGNQDDDFSVINFESKIFDAVNYFSSLDIPPFVISQSSELNELIVKILKEFFDLKVGKERVIQNLMEQIVVESIRYIVDNKMFLEQLATNTTYFKDPRLIEIFKHIKENLSGDLSNKMLANIANVSEDYVGQYFKMLTGINPQDYIEYQRMERAVYLLRTTKRSIREIGGDVGYKDTAYFCRRFKMMFGIPAGKMRKRETLIDV